MAVIKMMTVMIINLPYLQQVLYSAKIIMFILLPSSVIGNKIFSLFINNNFIVRWINK